MIKALGYITIFLLGCLVIVAILLCILLIISIGIEIAEECLGLKLNIKRNNSILTLFNYEEENEDE